MFQDIFYTFTSEIKILDMKPVLIALLFVAAVACTSQLYVPTEKNVNKVEPATLAELQQGHDLFINNCGKCHKLPNPGSHSNVEWKKILEKMAPKAKLNNDQSYLIFRYFVNR
jgi:cytochrome c5